jgi:transposase
MLIIIWHLLADPDARYLDLGPDHYTRTVNTEAKKRNHIRQLQALGYTVTIAPAARGPTRPIRLRRMLPPAWPSSISN